MNLAAREHSREGLQRHLVTSNAIQRIGFDAHATTLAAGLGSFT